MIWGDAVTNDKGIIRHMNYDDAMDYCIDMNPESERGAIRAALKSGQAPARGIYLPLRSDFARLRQQLGSTAKDTDYLAPGYKPQILPHLVYWFRSSSVHPVYSDNAYDFHGRTGNVDLDSRDYAGSNAVRCVARR